MGMEPQKPIEITCEYCGIWFPHINKEDFLCDNCESYKKGFKKGVEQGQKLIKKEI